MSAHDESHFKELSNAVVEMDEERAVAAAHAALEDGVEAYDAIQQGLSEGMARAGQLFEEEEYFIPELLMCSDAMYAGLEVLKPHLKTTGEARGTVVIGVVEGDTHDIGKNMVRIMFETGGFHVVDLGRDVPPQRFVDAAREVKADIIALSTLMTTTMEGMGTVVRLLEEARIRDGIKVMVGGGPISPGFAKRIGADGYAVNAAEAVKVAKELVGSA
ncbi:corrinoid protein [Geobacter sp. SVR]|uniref:corrinoid protein n=1 Tax=Geobacter sp. SVR TaxID=2495594 RepID=UPI00143F0164|nr:corrinoid protein [Geobacter sp. SVR]BCS54150.1 dimethylamine corrinoid protein [Geobacter sp. SVR]GCF87712.1 dimethylamine corrinoid protein [Geobacter sp. SVR]